MLAASGQQLVSEEHYLSATVRTGERESEKLSAPHQNPLGRVPREEQRADAEH